MYFDQKGNVNTETCIKMAVETARRRGIRTIVVASCHGDTARLFKGNRDLSVVCVAHAYGFGEPGMNDMTKETVDELESEGIRTLFTTHVLSGAERGISKKYGGVHPVEIIADTLRMLGQGTKVCAEIAIMALDAGLIPCGEDIIAVGGTARGADTAVIIRPAHANHVLDTKIKEIICKPREF